MARRRCRRRRLLVLRLDWSRALAVEAEEADVRDEEIWVVARVVVAEADFDDVADVSEIHLEVGRVFQLIY